MKNSKRIGLAVVSCILTLIICIGSTALYLTDTDTATNTVTVGDVKIDLTEPNWEDIEYVVPNQELTKDPQITNTSINDAIVFMTVEVPVKNITLVADDGTKGTKGNTELFWFKDSTDGASTHANNFDSNWAHLETKDVDANLTGTTRTYVFAYKTPLSSDDTTTPLFDKIQIKNYVENEIPGGEVEQIKINAYAIQASDVLESNVALSDNLTTANLTKIYDIFCKQAFNSTTPTTPTVEHENINYNIENTDVQTYMAYPDYDADDYSYTNFTGATIENAGKPATASMSLPDNAATITITDTTDNSTFTESVSGSTFTVRNVRPDRTYTYQVKDSNNTVVKDGQIAGTGQVRMIYFSQASGINNVRDIGGWETSSGNSIKYGRIYRGNLLDGNITSNDENIFTNLLGVTSEIDLRADDEVQNHSGNSSITGADYSRYAISAYDANPLHDQSLLASLITKIAQDLRQDKTIYIHCAAGADRTGTIIGIIEAICGVSQSDIDRDFELSSFVSPNRVRNGSSSSGWNTFIGYLERFDGDSFEEKAVNFALWAGVSAADVNTIRHELVGNSMPEVNCVAENVLDLSNVTHNVRINSSGGTASNGLPSTGSYFVTNFIPCNKNSIINVHTDLPQEGNEPYRIAFYDSNKDKVCIIPGGGVSWTWDSSRLNGEYNVQYLQKHYNISGLNIAYFRICMGYTDSSNLTLQVKRMNTNTL